MIHQILLHMRLSLMQLQVFLVLLLFIKLFVYLRSLCPKKVLIKRRYPFLETLRRYSFYYVYTFKRTLKVVFLIFLYSQIAEKWVL